MLVEMKLDGGRARRRMERGRGGQKQKAAAEEMETLARPDA